MEPCKYMRFWIAAALLISLALLTFPASSVRPCFGPGEIPAIIIDAGHGGEDGGAVSIDGAAESLINLEISMRLEQLLVFCGFDVITTRSSENIDYPQELATVRSRKVWDQKRRIELINTHANALLVSIHQNYYPSAKPFGAQVLYGKIGDSAALAEGIQKLIINKLQPENKRCAAAISDSIFLIREASCPAVLIECGFLSNPAESALLQTQTYQLKLSLIITSAISTYYIGDTYES